MGLDIYVGTFTRYYNRDWLLITQQRFPGQVTVFRQGGEQPKQDPEEVRNAIHVWAAGLASGLKVENLWSEDDSLPYFTDKPTWEGYSALLYWAACEDQGIDPLAKPVVADDALSEPIFERYKDKSVSTRYDQLLLDEELWLPIEAPYVFGTLDPAGKRRTFGNCRQLTAELDLLNSRTWKANTATLEQWRHDCFEHNAGIEAGARFAFAVMRYLAGEAVTHNLPMLLDY